MPVIRAILLSFSFHFLLILAATMLIPSFENSPPEVLEISFAPEAQILEALLPAEKKKQIVRQALAPEKLKLQDDETLARFLSEKKQRVQEETQAAQAGMTANRSNQATASPLSGGPRREKINMDRDGFKTFDVTRDLQEMNRFSDGMSTIGEAMPKDMKVGAFTALNSDRYLFYTFYARMEELIRFRWESRVQNAIDSFDPQTLSFSGNRNWVTQVEFLLDKNGYLKSAVIMKESGIVAFDLAAINAFRDARVFPNPPPEMVQEDGFIRIKFGFTVNYSPPTLVNRY